MKTHDFDYQLPPKYIAQTPLEPRDSARLLVLDRRNGLRRHVIFRDLGDFLTESDLLVLNETRVIPARLFGTKVPTGGKVEILLLKKIDELTWLCLVGGTRVTAKRRISIANGLEAIIVDELSDARRLIQFQEPVEDYLNKIGNMPLPPYIHAPLENPERYQTIYSKTPGSAAAPTAGLHFTQELLDRLKEKGIQTSRVTLHVGLDTFAPVNEDEPSSHTIHTEWCQVPDETVSAIQETRARGGRIIAVGTTSVRALETAASLAPEGEEISMFEGPTGLFILPGYQFKLVDGIITNFHLPRSTLIMLVSAFAGRELILNTYQEAKEMNYRFYSFGDAMLIL